MIKQVKKALIIGLILNIFLAALKVTFGYLGNSKSLVSDGYNSLTDFLITGMLFISVYISSKKPDRDHQYGHEKYEGISNLFLGIILVATGVYIIYQGIADLIGYDSSIEYIMPSAYLFIVIIIAILVKTYLFLLNLKMYKTYKQASLKADSYNHLIDIFATTTSLLGIIFASLNLIYIDYIASIIIGLMILKTAFSVTKESISFLVDETPNQELLTKIKETIKVTNGVIGIDDFKARKHMNKVYVDVEIAVDKNLSLVNAHKIAEEVHLGVERKYKSVIHCMVHVNPK